MKNILLLIVLYFSSSYALYGQKILPEPEMQTITFQELISNLTTGSDSVYELKDAIVSFSKSTDARYLYSQYKYTDNAFTDSIIDIHKEVIFKNVRFNNHSSRDFYTIAGWHFYKKVQFENTRNVFVNHSTFEDAFIFTEGKVIGELISHNLIIEDCVFNGKFNVISYSENEQFGISIENNVFNETKKSVIGNFSTNPNIMINTYKLEYAGFRFNKINYDQSSFLFQIGNTDLIYFDKNEIRSNRWNYMQLTEVNSLIFIQNKIEADLLFDLDKLESKYDLQWPITSKSMLPLNYFFAVQDTFEITDEEVDIWKNSNQGANDLLYKNGLTQLSKFHTYFQNFNDRQSANDVYVKIKDLESGRLKSLYKENPSFENFFELLVIRFLKRFSNYGTSPSKIVISAFQIILLFAFLFLFSSNSWNSVNFKILNDKIKPSISYFVTNNSIENSFRNHKIGQDQYAESQSLLTQNRKNIPAVFYFPSITFVKIQHKIAAVKLKIWKYFNVVEGSWIDLPKRKKITNSILLSAFLFFFVAFKALTLLLNALTLSINSFTTLGFGEIPIKGLGRYLAILEGFIGWIFLTLFSVTLISQVLS